MPDDSTPPELRDGDRRDAPTYRRGAWWPAFALLLLPFLFVFKPLYKTVRQDLNWRAALATIFCFEIFMMCAEHYSLQRGHWVYNEARILGPKIFGVPIEEPFLYYWFPALIVIVVLLSFRRWVLRRSPTC